jgi:hypothetical protein
MPTNYIVRNESDIDNAVQRGNVGDIVSYLASEKNKSEIHLIEPAPNGKNGKYQIGDSKIFSDEAEIYNISKYDMVIFPSQSPSSRKRKHSNSSRRGSSSRSPKRAKNIPSFPHDDFSDIKAFVREHNLKVGDEIPLYGDGQGDYGYYKVKAADVLSGGRKSRRAKKSKKARGRKTKRRY